MLNLVMAEIEKEGHTTEIFQLAGHTIIPAKHALPVRERVIRGEGFVECHKGLYP